VRRIHRYHLPDNKPVEQHADTGQMLLDRGSRPLAVQLLGSCVPVYREGETVAVTDRAHVYRLTERITGSDFVDMQRYLRTLDRSKLLGIDATKQMMHDRAEQYAAAVKVLAALNPVKRTERTTGRELTVAADPDPALFASNGAPPLEPVAGLLQVNAVVPRARRPARRFPWC
jgi:hypothetical protein